MKVSQMSVQDSFPLVSPVKVGVLFMTRQAQAQTQLWELHFRVSSLNNTSFSVLLRSDG